MRSSPSCWAVLGLAVLLAAGALGGGTAFAAERYTDGTFRPGAAISRQQMNSILARHISEKEIEAKGSVKGVVRNYPSLQAWHEAEGSFYLGGFNEANQVAAVHRPGTAYLVYHKVIQGSADFGALHLKAVLRRDQDLPGEHPAHRLHRRLR